MNRASSHLRSADVTVTVAPMTTAGHAKSLPDSGFLRGLPLAIAVGVLLWAILVALDVLVAYELASA